MVLIKYQINIVKEKELIFEKMIKLYDRYSNLNKFIEDEVIHYINENKKCCCIRDAKDENAHAPSLDLIRNKVMMRKRSSMSPIDTSWFKK